MQAAEYGVRQAAGWESTRRSLQNSPPLVLAKPHRCLSKSVLSLVVAELLSCVRLIATLWTAEWQTPLSSTVSWSLSNSCLLSWWFYPTISSSATPFFCLQSFPASRSFPISWLFASDGQSIAPHYICHHGLQFKTMRHHYSSTRMPRSKHWQHKGGGTAGTLITVGGAATLEDSLGVS